MQSLGVCVTTTEELQRHIFNYYYSLNLILQIGGFTGLRYSMAHILKSGLPSLLFLFHMRYISPYQNDSRFVTFLSRVPLLIHAAIGGHNIAALIVCVFYNESIANENLAGGQTCNCIKILIEKVQASPYSTRYIEFCCREI